MKPVVLDGRDDGHEFVEIGRLADVGVDTGVIAFHHVFLIIGSTKNHDRDRSQGRIRVLAFPPQVIEGLLAVGNYDRLQGRVGFSQSLPGKQLVALIVFYQQDEFPPAGLARPNVLCRRFAGDVNSGVVHITKGNLIGPSPPLLSLRRLTVLNAGFKHARIIKKCGAERRAPRTDGSLMHFASPPREKSGLARLELGVRLSA